MAIVRGIAAYIVGLLRARGGAGPEEVIRLTLGRALSLALEFQVAADILGTALDPTQQDLIILAAVVALRTLLNYFLGRELDAARPPRSGRGRRGGRGRDRRAARGPLSSRATRRCGHRGPRRGRVHAGPPLAGASTPTTALPLQEWGRIIRARRRDLVENIAASVWLVPTLPTLLAAGLATLTLFLDETIPTLGGLRFWLFGGSASAVFPRKSPFPDLKQAPAPVPVMG